MQIERHKMPDGSEEFRRLIITAPTPQELRQRLFKAYQQATEQETLVGVSQVQFDPEHDPCPCGSKRLAKNCCAKKLVRRMIAERKVRENKE